MMVEGTFIIGISFLIYQSGIVKNEEEVDIDRFGKKLIP